MAKENRKKSKICKKRLHLRIRVELEQPDKTSKKTNNEIRMRLNLMALNQITRKEEYRMPNIEYILNNLQVSKFFTVLDLKEGYFQIKIRNEDKHKTAFEVNGKKYEFNRMPMGFKNSPFIFQRIMNEEHRK